MNQMRKGVLVLALVTIGAFALWPPWKASVRSEGRTLTAYEQSIKHPLGKPPHPIYQIDVTRLALEWTVVAVIAAVTGLFLGNCNYPLFDNIPQWFKKTASVPQKEPSMTTTASIFPVGQSRTIDKVGRASGIVTRYSDGKSSLGFGPNADLTTLLTSSFIIFANFLKPENRATVADWAGWQTGPWDDRQREYFSLALMHHFHDLKESGATVPEGLQDAIEELPPNALPPLDRPLTAAVRKVFNGMFGG